MNVSVLCGQLDAHWGVGQLGPRLVVSNLFRSLTFLEFSEDCFPVVDVELLDEMSGI